MPENHNLRQQVPVGKRKRSAFFKPVFKVFFCTLAKDWRIWCRMTLPLWAGGLLVLVVQGDGNTLKLNFLDAFVASNKGPGVSFLSLLTIALFQGILRPLSHFWGIRFLVLSEKSSYKAALGHTDYWKCCAWSLALSCSYVVFFLPAKKSFSSPALYAFLKPVPLWGFLALFLAALGFSFYISARLMLLLPAVALGRKRPWSVAWALTKGHVLPITLSMAALLLMFFCCWGLLAAAFSFLGKFLFVGAASPVAGSAASFLMGTRHVLSSGLGSLIFYAYTGVVFKFLEDRRRLSI